VWFIHNEKKIVNFWRIEDAPEIRFSHDQDYIDGFIEHFRRAVQVRLNSIRPIGTQLSAGLDSSSVTALAAQALLETNQPLVAYTSVPIHPVENIFPGRLTNEWPLAHQVAERYTNIEHIPIKSEDISPLEAAKLIVNILHEPQHAATNMFWIISIFENAKSRNIGVMLTGQLGNGGVSWSGGRDYIFYLFARNQWQKGLRALTAWKKHHGFSWHKAIKNQILRPVLFPFMFEYQRVLHPDKQTNFTYSFPKKEFIQQMGLTENDIINIQSKSIDPLTERILTSTRNGMVVGFIWNSFGSYYNMDVRDPTSDIRLLEFCMGIPDEQFVFEGGDRMLIRRAMCGILPDSIRQNICKGRQAADAFIRIIHDYKEMERALALLETSPAVTQYLDVQAIKSTLDSLGFPNTRTPPLAANALIRAINTGHFLLSFSSYT
jgi:asparagine synthase (glutamine-hydrolysing)